MHNADADIERLIHAVETRSKKMGEVIAPTLFLVRQYLSHVPAADGLLAEVTHYWVISEAKRVIAGTISLHQMNVFGKDVGQEMKVLGELDEVLETWLARWRKRIQLECSGGGNAL